jgi:uncharacterized protein YdhG (YjbR/CyaY superfamily)
MRNEMRESEKRIDTIDDYIKKYPSDVQATLKKIRQAIKESAPAAREAIGYGMPTFKLNGNLVHFAAYKNHIGFYPTSSGIAAFEKELNPYKTSKGAVQFPIDEPIPYDLIKKIVKYRVKEQNEKTKAGKN